MLRIRRKIEIIKMSTNEEKSFQICGFSNPTPLKKF